MKRLIFNDLKHWVNSKKHKVLLLRGARQVGKTYIVKQLGKTFTYYIEVNFEKDTDVKEFFNKNLDPERINLELSAYYGIPIKANETLVFFDEIQACSRAIEALRFYYEQLPELHVIAAGSLLEFALDDLPSFGVGRIRSMFMYPLSFDEFLMALGEDALLELKKQANPKNPLNETLHSKLIDLLKRFLIIGGMPEVVKSYIEESDIIEVQNVLHDITISYYDDFAKYKKRITSLRLQEVLDSAVKQAGGKFIYSNAGALSNTQQAKEAMELLIKAGLVHRVFHTSAQGLPLGGQANRKMFKPIIIDTGIFQKRLNLKLSDQLLANNIDVLNKGNIAEIFVGLEMIKYTSPLQIAQLYYWHREKRGSNAEVDYIIEKANRIYPVEVKSGKSGKMQSLRRFIEENKVSSGIRISLENYCKYDDIEVIPLYAISNLIE